MLSLPRERYYKTLPAKIGLYFNFWLKYAYWLNDNAFIVKVIHSAQDQGVYGGRAKHRGVIDAAIKKAGVRVTLRGVFFERQQVVSAAMLAKNPAELFRKDPRSIYDNRKAAKVPFAAARRLAPPDPSLRLPLNKEGESLYLWLKVECQRALKIIYQKYDLYLSGSRIILKKRLTKKAAAAKLASSRRQAQNKAGHRNGVMNNATS